MSDSNEQVTDPMEPVKQPKVERRHRWKILWQKPRSRYWLGIPLGGILMFIAGVIVWGYKNASGVRAICSDCHVPRPWVYKVVRKIKASNEIFHKLLGSIDTREKFEAKRLKLAETVWAAMKETDSRECRNCHAFETMELESQDKSARRRHTLKRQLEKGETCIDCHKGIAHELPEGY